MGKWALRAPAANKKVTTCFSPRRSVVPSDDESDVEELKPSTTTTEPKSTEPTKTASAEARRMTAIEPTKPRAERQPKKRARTETADSPTTPPHMNAEKLAELFKDIEDMPITADDPDAEKTIKTS